MLYCRSLKNSQNFTNLNSFQKFVPKSFKKFWKPTLVATLLSAMAGSTDFLLSLKFKSFHRGRNLWRPLVSSGFCRFFNYYWPELTWQTTAVGLVQVLCGFGGGGGPGGGGGARVWQSTVLNTQIWPCDPPNSVKSDHAKSYLFNY